MYYSEKLNSITHLVGTVFALMGMGALLTVAVQQKNILLFTGFFIFGLTLVTLYSFSTLYHSFKHPLVKRLFQKLDHIAIYFLIAGTYTPFMLVTLYDSNGLWILLAVWSLALVGIALELRIKNRIEALQVVIYLTMGWLVVLDFGALKAALPEAGMNWLIALTASGICLCWQVHFAIL
jgi:hemolysin III